MSPTELVLTDSAAIAMLDEAERALAEVNAPEDANELWRRIKAVEEAARLARLAEATVGAMTRVRLRAKRRWGELLGPADDKGGRPRKTVTDGHGFTGGGDRREPPREFLNNEATWRDSGAYRKETERARKLAAVPAEAFEAALENTEPDRPPSEASLLRMSRPMDIHFSSATDEWATPQDLFDTLNAEFKFDLDVCALPSSAKCKRYFSPEDDGLAQKWKGICWMNPPYGEVIGDWMAKALESASEGATVVCLVPARVDTGWWWDNCRWGEIRFIRGRLKFGNATTSAPFPSAVVVFGPGFPPKVKWWERER